MTPQRDTSTPGRLKGRGPYAKSAAVRHRILEACIEAFGTSGFHGTTMKDIARRAGLSQTGLMHHFPTKADLLIGVLQERAEQEARMVRSVDGYHLLERQAGVVHDNESRPGLIQLHSIISTEATSADHPAHALYRRRYEALRRQMTAEFTELRDLGRLRVGTPPAVLANLFVAILDGLQVQWLYSPEEVEMSTDFQAFLDVIILPSEE